MEQSQIEGFKIIGIMIGIPISLLITLLISRWIFRINEIVDNQHKTIIELKKLALKIEKENEAN